MTFSSSLVNTHTHTHISTHTGAFIPAGGNDDPSSEKVGKIFCEPLRNLLKDFQGPHLLVDGPVKLVCLQRVKKVTRVPLSGSVRLRYRRNSCEQRGHAPTLERPLLSSRYMTLSRWSSSRPLYK